MLSNNNNSLLILFVFAFLQDINCSHCVQRKYDRDSFVCVCNSTYCDTIEQLPNNLTSNQYVTYTSTRDALRLQQNIGENIESTNQQTPDMIISRNNTYQTMMGFGGAMTDAAAINIASLEEPGQDLVLRQYFGDEGTQYTILRIPIGGTDYSTHAYTLDDTDDDTDLKDFKLSDEDINHKIPFTKKAMELSTTYPIKLMGCSWSGPAYMKESKTLKGQWQLLRQYYQVYANYLTKFLQEYQKHGLNFTIISAQNEPTLGGTPLITFNGMSFNPFEEADFVYNNLAPTLAENGFGDVQIMVGDDSRHFVAPFLSDMLSYNPNISQYIGGIGIHFYLDSYDSPETLIRIRETPGFEGKFILYTEASANIEGPIRGVTYGYWVNGELYLENMIDNINHWSQGWMDWNLMLNLDSGPRWVDNPVDAPIIVNASAQEFYKNPMYYALVHMSKFVVPGSVRINLVNNNDAIKASAFDTPNNQTVLVLLNKNEVQYNLIVHDVEKNQYKNLNIPPKSFTTVIY